MDYLRAILKTLLSLKTASLLLVAQLLLFLFGAFQMPAMEAYSSLNEMPLFEWMRKAPAGATWWLWGSVVIAALLALNTVFCSFDALLRKRQGRSWLLVTSPQIIHLGFLFLMLAHLVDASQGFRGMVVAREGVQISLSGGERLVLKEIRSTLSPQGFPLDFRADALFTDREGRKIKEKVIAPNKPAFHRGAGFYLKQVRGRAALVEVTREPGAPIALLGGVLSTGALRWPCLSCRSTTPPTCTGISAWNTGECSRAGPCPKAPPWTPRGVRGRRGAHLGQGEVQIIGRWPEGGQVGVLPGGG
jgi:hypothetical protein